MRNDPNDCQRLLHALPEFFRVGRWLDNPLRRVKVRISQDRVFETKIELALDMMDRATQDRAIQAGIRADVIRADCDYLERLSDRVL